MLAAPADELGRDGQRFIGSLTPQERVLLLRRSPQQWAAPMREALGSEVFAEEFLAAWELGLQ